MDPPVTVLIALTLINLILIIWLMISRLRQGETAQSARIEAAVQSLKAELISKQMEGLLSLRESLDTANRLLNERLAEGTSTLDRRMAVIGEIENKLGELSMQARNIEAIGENIQSLSELLRPPKLRGNLGEIFLENLLAQILPKSLYATQHKFSDGQRVDTVVKLADRLLPIDSKFPLESYRRLTSNSVSDADAKATAKAFSQTIKKHIDSISAKYLRPHENTTDFAIMYIPSEAVYYQFVAGENPEDFQYALAKKVIPSSPGHLYGFLASISAMYTEAGLTANHRLLADRVSDLSQSLARLSRLDDRLTGSLRSASLSFDKIKEEHGRMSYQLDRLREPRVCAENDSDN